MTYHVPSIQERAGGVKVVDCGVGEEVDLGGRMEKVFGEGPGVSAMMSWFFEGGQSVCLEGLEVFWIEVV